MDYSRRNQLSTDNGAIQKLHKLMLHPQEIVAETADANGK